MAIGTPETCLVQGLKRGRAPGENKSVFSWGVRMGESKDVEEIWGTDGKGKEGHRELSKILGSVCFFVPQLKANTKQVVTSLCSIFLLKTKRSGPFYHMCCGVSY